MIRQSIKAFNKNLNKYNLGYIYLKRTTRAIFGIHFLTLSLKVEREFFPLMFCGTSLLIFAFCSKVCNGLYFVMRLLYNSST